MNDHSEGPETFNMQQWLSEVVRRNLLQTGAMQAVEEKMREVSERSAHMTESADRHSEEEGAA
ncbi:MAG TPA: hypothetical protein VK961_11055 [Chthoniobacter sp.]|nr:hypothetical protein [Chthoniobacter sp.]